MMKAEPERNEQEMAGEESKKTEDSGEKGIEARIDALKLQMDEAVDAMQEIAEGIKILGWNEKHDDRLKKTVEGIEETLRVRTADLERTIQTRQRKVHWLRSAALLAAVIMAIPATGIAGLFVQRQWEVLGVSDPTAGWKDYVWNRYGVFIKDCHRAAGRGGEILDCVLRSAAPAKTASGERLVPVRCTAPSRVTRTAGRSECHWLAMG